MMTMKRVLPTLLITGALVTAWSAPQVRAAGVSERSTLERELVTVTKQRLTLVANGFFVGRQTIDAYLAAHETYVDAELALAFDDASRRLVVQDSVVALVDLEDKLKKQVAQGLRSESDLLAARAARISERLRLLALKGA